MRFIKLSQSFQKSHKNLIRLNLADDHMVQNFEVHQSLYIKIEGRGVDQRQKLISYLLKGA